MKRTIALLTTALLVTPLAFSEEPPIKKERGRYWYEKPSPEPKETEAPTEKEVAALQPEEVYKRPILPPMKELMTYHPKQIEKLYEEIHDYHVYKNSMDTAVDLLVLNNVLSKKSRAAAAVSELAMLQNPALSGQFENPVAPSVKNLTNQKQSVLVHERLTSHDKEFAFVVFTQPSCAACDLFRNTLALFQDKYGWQVKEYNIHQHVGLATRFNIYGTPTTILVQKNTSEWLPVAQGAQPFTTLVKNTSQGIRLLKKEITPAQWLTSDVQTESYFDPNYTPVEVRKDNL